MKIRDSDAGGEMEGEELPLVEQLVGEAQLVGGVLGGKGEGNGELEIKGGGGGRGRERGGCRQGGDTAPFPPIPIAAPLHAVDANLALTAIDYCGSVVCCGRK